MAISNSPNDIINRIQSGNWNDSDLESLRQLLLNNDKETLQQLGKFNVSIDEGREIHIGDRNYFNWSDEAIQAVVEVIQQGKAIAVFNPTGKVTIYNYTNYYREEKRAVTDERTEETEAKKTKTYGAKNTIGINHLSRRKIIKCGCIGIGMIGSGIIAHWLDDLPSARVEVLDDVQSVHTGLISFDFNVVTLNKKGEEINRETKIAQKFIESLGKGIDLEMVRIPRGRIRIGSPDEEKKRDNYSEELRDWATIQEFFLGKYPVTQAQWEQVASLSKNKYDLPSNPSSNLEGKDHPVQNVSWEDAQEFCARLSKYTKKNYRLSREVEWEYACRGGTETPFHFGETITTKYVNYNGYFTYAEEEVGDYLKKTTPVGKFKVANSFGLYDMHGNVWEWCEDGWNDKKVIRGGCFNDPPKHCRSARRHGDPYYNKNQNIGFRVVCMLG